MEPYVIEEQLLKLTEAIGKTTEKLDVYVFALQKATEKLNDHTEKLVAFDMKVDSLCTISKNNEDKISAICTNCEAAKVIKNGKKVLYGAMGVVCLNLLVSFTDFFKLGLLQAVKIKLLHIP